MDWQDEQKQEVEEFTHQPFPRYQFTFRDVKQYECDTLVISLYGASSLFAHSVIKVQHAENLVNFAKSKQQSLADVYDTKDGNVYLIFNDEIQKMKEVHFSEFISTNFKFKQCIIMCSLPQSNLNDPSNTCLRSISTNAWNPNPSCGHFTQGLMGLAADVLVWAELNQLPVCCYIGIVADYQLNRQIVDSVFGSLRGKHGMNENTQTFQRIRKYNMKKYSNKLYL